MSFERFDDREKKIIWKNSEFGKIRNDSHAK